TPAFMFDHEAAPVRLSACPGRTTTTSPRLSRHFDSAESIVRFIKSPMPGVRRSSPAAPDEWTYQSRPPVGATMYPGIAMGPTLSAESGIAPPYAWLPMKVRQFETPLSQRAEPV